MAMFGFCMSRVGTHVLRLALATRPRNIRLAMAALIFTNIGVLVVYIVLLLLALRVFRATHPKLGWNRPLGRAFTVSYVLLLCAVLLVVAFTILSFYTLDPKLKSVALWVQRGAILYMMLFNVASLVLLLLSALLPREPDNENFGTGSMESKLIILGVAIFFIIFIAGFRTGTSWSPPRPASHPAWFDSKPAFYVILFSFEIIIVYLLLFTRFDKRFWVPNGSKRPGDYSRIGLDDATAEKSSDQDRTSEQTKVSVQDKDSVKGKESLKDDESVKDQEEVKDKESVYESVQEKNSIRDEELVHDKESLQDRESVHDKELLPGKESVEDKV